MSNAFAELEADAAEWYRNNMYKLIADGGNFVDDVVKLYAPPFTYLDLEGEIPLTGQQETTEFIQSFSDWLDESPGWRAELAGIQTQALNDTGMVLVAEWRIVDSEGKSVSDGETIQYFYMLSRRDGTWQVVGEGTVSAKTRVELK